MTLKIIPQLTQIQAFTLAGMSVRTKNEDEFNSDAAQLPHLWERFFTWQQKEGQQNGSIYGVYHHYESDASGYYTVTAGIKPSVELKASPFDKVDVVAGHYLVFEAKGANPAAIIRAWQTVWAYFADEPKWQRAYLTDFEVYQTPGESAVYIGVKGVGKIRT